MRYSRRFRPRAGGGQVLPSVTFEFLGSVNWTMGFPGGVSAVGRSVHPLLRLDVGDVVGERVGMYRPIIEPDIAGVGVQPRERVLHPALVVALGKILARMGAAALGAVLRRVHG